MRVSKVLLCLFSILSLSFSLSTCKSTKRIDKDDIMYAMIYDYDNNEIQNVSIFVDGVHVGESDVHGRYLFQRNKNYFTVELRKPSYETVSASLSFDTLKVVYFKIANAEQLRTLSEDSLSVREYAQALDYCTRAQALSPDRQDILYLKAIILNKLDRKSESNLILNSMINKDSIQKYKEDLINENNK